MPSLMPANAVEPIGQRPETRIVISLPGRYSLWTTQDSGHQLKQYACRAISMSPTSVALVAPVRGSVGDWVSAEIEYFGKLEGSIKRLLHQRGFVMQPVASREERANLANKIEWFEKYKNLELADLRAHARFVPENPISTLIFADGTVNSCFILDLSASGVAISSDSLPEISTVLAVGSVVGRVIRHFHGGFAVKFVSVQDRQSVEEHVRHFCR